MKCANLRFFNVKPNTTTYIYFDLDKHHNRA